MRRTSKVAKRYAKGLLVFTQEVQNTASVFGEMKDLVKILEASKELNAFFNSPFIEAKKKISVTENIFSTFSPTSRNIIALAIRSGREDQLKAIAQEYINSVEDLNGIQRISLTTAIQLSPKNIDRILKNSSLVNHDKTIDMQISVKPDILGGYILRVGDLQVDDSVRTKLSNIRKKIELN
ncbi:ATP synthase F1 subunit delta [Elizabethkingia argentiflava]|uniref:ATP synthase subunit delta n=1 Tax=Elizabethkingia argenteiflava TaxID=2681556 RepID=A0A845PYI1_9FLAO|nr:ATP synthase F1 subunit delta [Elizabethkingia argenteiflava]NAW51140.1 ATP synthase F1 subunit delta [Elizabethkingia argenteiflava]